MASNHPEEVGMDVEIRTLEPQKTMVVRSVIPKEKLGDAFMTNLPKVYGYVGSVAAGAPFGRYPAFSDDGVDVEIGLPVTSHLDAKDDITPSEIPGGRYAVTVHRGSYDGLPATYDALFNWIGEHGHTPAGPPFESYIDDPGSTPADQLRTEVLVPIG